MGLWNNDPNVMLVAGHRGACDRMPENTMTAFRYAMEIGCDMIETDIHQTKDHQLVLIHDDDVKRTTDGCGRVRSFTLAEFRKLNAAAHVEGFAPEKPPLLEELLEMVQSHPAMLLNLELKDYPTNGEDDWAYETADRTIELVEKYALGDRCILNSFSGKLLAHIAEKYHHQYPLHGFYPYFFLGDEAGDPESYLDVACLFPNVKDENGKVTGLGTQVCPQAWYDYLAEKNIEPWIGAGVKTYDDIKVSFDRGARLITTNDPAHTLRFLREMGHHA